MSVTTDLDAAYEAAMNEAQSTAMAVQAARIHAIEATQRVWEARNSYERVWRFRLRAGPWPATLGHCRLLDMEARAWDEYHRIVAIEVRP